MKLRNLLNCISRQARLSHGSAIIVVILFLIFSTNIIAGFTQSVRNDLTVVTQSLTSFHGKLLAENVGYFVATEQFGKPSKALLENQNCSSNGTTLKLRTVGSSQQVNLNYANKSSLITFLGFLNLSESKTISIAQDILAYRNPLSDQHNHSPFKYGNKFAPFESVSELVDHEELKTIPIQELYRYFTVHGTKHQVDGNTSNFEKAAVFEEGFLTLFLSVIVGKNDQNFILIAENKTHKKRIKFIEFFNVEDQISNNNSFQSHRCHASLEETLAQLSGGEFE